MRTDKESEHKVITWCNNTKRIHNADTEGISKPCHLCGFCPYGTLVEAYPLAREGVLDNGYSCNVFGHDCPVFYIGESIMEDD